MRRSLTFAALFLALIVGLIAGSPQRARAFSLQEVATFFQANDVHQDQNGSLVVEWQKIVLGFGGYGMSNQAIGVMINATTSLEDWIAWGSGAGAAHLTGTSPIVGELTQAGGGCSPGFDSWGPASQAISGNTATFDRVWDGNLGASVSSTAIGFQTPIYIVLIAQPYSSCGVFTGTTYQDAQETFINSTQEPVAGFFFQPFQDETIGEFDEWRVGLTNNMTSTATGTLQINYGISSSSYAFHDTSTYELAPGTDFNFNVQKTQALTFPQQTTPLTYYAQIELLNASSGLDLLSNAISFSVLPGAPTSQINPIGFPQFNQSSTNEYGVSCGYSSSSFFSDPAGNIQIGFCNVMLWAFVPTRSQNAYLGSTFSDLISKVAHKPPFGYLTAATNEISNLAPATSSTSTLLNASSSLALASVLVPMDAGIATIIGFLLLTWIYGRGRHIEL